MVTRFLCVISLLAGCGELRAGFITFTNSGSPGTANSLAAFEAGIGGTNNGNNGPQGNGFRTINWDDVPGGSTDTPLNGTFNFYQNRGALISGLGGGQMEVANDGFGSFNAGYPALFPAFSGSNIFAPLNVLDTFVNFTVPGTSTPATTTGFGAVFLDANDANTSGITLFDSANNQIAQVFLSGTASGPAFLGLLWDGTGPQIAKAEIMTGNSFVDFGLNQNLPTRDVVALDNFAFGEPQQAAIPEPGTWEVGVGLMALALFGARTRVKAK